MQSGIQKIVIVGAGGFGREIVWLIERINAVSPSWEIVGFVDDDPNITTVGAHEVLGSVDWLSKRDGEPLAVAVAIGSSTVRRGVCRRLLRNGSLSFPNLIDPTVILSDSVRMGRGSIICASTILTVDIELGDFCIINLDCTVGHDARIDDYVTLYPSVNVSGATRLSECVEMGTGSQTIQMLSVGEETVVGAGAVVIKNLPARCTAVGVPARPVAFRDVQNGAKHED